MDNSEGGFQVFFVALVIMVCATKEDKDRTECWIFVALLMHTRLEICIREDLQVGMCLTYLEVQLIG